jgi:NAD+ synthase
MPSQADRISGWMHDRLGGSHALGFVVGLSGGVDSAVVARLAQLAAGDNVVGVLMPCHSDARDEADARLVADQFKLRTLRVDLAQSYDALISGLLDTTAAIPGSGGGTADDIRARLPHVNVKPRLRMTTLYFIANTLNYLVAGTGNRSELVLGYFTKYGDGGVDLLPIGHLVKSQVRELARELGVPAPVIDKAPSAGLWIGQTDEAEMGFTYADLERYLSNGAGSVSPALAEQIERLMRASEHKRALAPVPDL